MKSHDWTFGPLCALLCNTMKWIAGGIFIMGANDFYPEEAPAHPVKVSVLDGYDDGDERGFRVVVANTD